MNVRDNKQPAPNASYPMVTRIAVVLAGLSIATTSTARAADKFRQLTAAQINSVVIGKVITDDDHWSDHFYSDGTLKSIQMGETVRGTWRLDGDTLCATRIDRRGKRETKCNEVWMSNENVEYRQFGTTVAEGIRRGSW